MVLDGIVSSPHRRSQSQTAFSSLPLKRLHLGGDELGSWLTLVQRHRFLLTTLGLLAFLCTIYLYFAVTLGAGDSCSGLTGFAKASCDLQRVKAFVAKGKRKVRVGAYDQRTEVQEWERKRKCQALIFLKIIDRRFYWVGKQGMLAGDGEWRNGGNHLGKW